jgi:outer membrane protein TolC
MRLGCSIQGRRGSHLGTTALLASLVAACASFSPDGGMDAVGGIASAELSRDAVKIRTNEDAALARDRTARLLRSMLSADMAVQIALLNNKGLQVAYNELGISEAQFVAASLPPNPSFVFSQIAGAVDLEIERRVLADVLAILTLPARKEIAEDQFRQAQLKAAEATLRLAADTRRAYYGAVAAGSLVGFLEKSRMSAETGAELAKKLGETGALNKLDQAREDAFHADVVAQLAQARLTQRTERERLTRLMGLWGADVDYRLPATLPPVPKHARKQQDVEVEAIRRRVDLRIARMQLVALAKKLGLAQASRFVNTLQLAGIDKRERNELGEDHLKGFEVDFEIPIFDLGETRVRRAEEEYMQAVNRLAEKAVNIRSEARDAYQRYRGTFDVARHYQAEVLPLRKIINDEVLTRYNGMITDLFQLLVDQRAGVASNIAAIQAQRDFWLAATDLTVAVIGGGVAGEANANAVATAAGDPSGH